MAEQRTDIEPNSTGPCHQDDLRSQHKPKHQQGPPTDQDTIACFPRSFNPPHHLCDTCPGDAACSIPNAIDNSTFQFAYASGRYDDATPTGHADRRHDTCQPVRLARDEAGESIETQEPTINDGNDGDDDSAVGRSKVRQDAAVDGPHIGCPYFKYNPLQHMGCLTRNSLKSIAIMVQHVLRSHGKPMHCPVCGQLFKKKRRCDEHIRQGMCQQKAFFHPGLTPRQAHEIRKLSSTCRKSSAKAKWDRVWDIIYPGVTPPHSHCVQEPIAEILNLVLRAREYGRANSIVRDPLTVYLNQLGRPSASHADHQTGTHPTVPDIERTVLDWDYVRSVIPEQDNLSFLTSYQPYRSSIGSFLESSTSPGFGRTSTSQHHLPSPQQQSMPCLVESTVGDGLNAGMSASSHGWPQFVVSSTGFMPNFLSMENFDQATAHATDFNNAYVANTSSNLALDHAGDGMDFESHDDFHVDSCN